MKSKYPTSVQSIERGLTILEELSHEIDGLRITELVKRTNLPASTVHRLLSVFVKRGYVTRDRGGYSYRLDIKFLDLGFIPVSLFCDIYRVICDRFIDWMVRGRVNEVFVKIATRFLSVRADRSQEGNGALLVPELTGSTPQDCKENYPEAGAGKCRSIDRNRRGALYRIREDGESWCTCLPMNSKGGVNGRAKIGAGGTGYIPTSDLMTILSSLRETRKEIGRIKVRENRRDGHDSMSLT